MLPASNPSIVGKKSRNNYLCKEFNNFTVENAYKNLFFVQILHMYVVFT